MPSATPSGSTSRAFASTVACCCVTFASCGMAAAYPGSTGHTMGEWRRHAIFFAPPAGSALARFGAGWLGWDAAAGAECEGAPDFPGLPRPRAALVAGPDRYGFHATLKPPFRLRSGDQAGLAAALTALAARHAPFALHLRPAVIAGFVALLPRAPSPQARRPRRCLCHRARHLPRSARP